MLEPREADIPALFLVLVVLPLVAYVLLGKWSESAKKRERISLLAHLAAEEARRADAMAVADVIPPVAPPKNVASTKNGLQSCARCFSPATTRCAKCKSVRYCSGKCQIIHWREVHKQDCQQMEIANSSSPLMTASFGESFHNRLLPNDIMNSQYFGYGIEQTMANAAASENIIHPLVSTGVSVAADCSAIDPSQVSMTGRKSTEKRFSRKSNKEALRRKEGVATSSSRDASGCWDTCTTSANIALSKEASKGSKARKSDACVLEESVKKQSGNVSDSYVHRRAASGSMVHDNDWEESQPGNIYESQHNQGFYSSKYVSKGHEVVKDFISNGVAPLRGESMSCDEQVEFRCSAEMTPSKGGAKTKKAPYSLGSKSCKLPKSTVKETSEQFSSEREKKKGQMAESKSSRIRDASVQAGNGSANARIMKMMGLRKPTKLTRKDVAEVCHRVKMLFPYDEFMKFFQYEVFDLSPRGLLNCGNSCYANAVLQCLTSTKPLTIYWLHRSHSRACCGKDWCLMCELEEHVTMLREMGGPLSPSRILLHMRSINCHIGDGSQEDAHEFLRLLVASMQAICLEGLGGENKVDPRLQETTFIQHTFGGYLRSKVKCLRCHHESERYENIMDLTLEIYGWVESLEDALTQFTTPEDLDGENMYRCGRCATYVQARKQLSIHEAPNILTIVLKRFQEGRYGKINKCITFPDMLDMIPFMTGTGDNPPLYFLYAVVVHLDTLNASFSGHYVSYVKDLQGNWFRIDDTEVQPVSMSQVMSEGAYILFYMRSCPRPQRAFSGRSAQPQVSESTRRCTAKPLRSAQNKPNGHYVGTEPLTDLSQPDYANGFINHGSNGILRSTNQNAIPVMKTYTKPISRDFSDVASSDWSIFTSSDEASFTTESTRDSFSTVDYADTNVDPISSIFNTIYMPEYSHNSSSGRKLPKNPTQTRFFSQDKGRILDSYLSAAQPLERAPRGSYSQQHVSDSPAVFLPENSNCGVDVRFGSNQVHWD